MRSKESQVQRRPSIFLVLEAPASLAIRTHLQRHGADVLCSPLEGLERELSSSCPDVIVLGLPAFAERNHSTLLGTRLRVARSKQAPPLIAWAPWGERDVVPARSLVDAVVPLELPLSAAAHRVFVLAKRAMQGHALDSRREPRTSTNPPPSLRNQTPSDRKPTVRRIPINGMPTPARGMARVCASTPSEPTAAPEWDVHSSEPSSRTSARANPSVPSHSGVRASSSPSTIRVPLTAPRESSSGVRIVLVDHDLTRADALLTTLRARRIQVHPTSPDFEDFHLRLTRRFSPHGIVVDETILRTRGAQLVERMRADPFLRHAQLIVVDLQRLFRAEVGATSLQPLIPLLESLGHAEAALFDKLGPTCEVELGLDEIPAHLLLRLLSTRTLWTDLRCSSATEFLEWSVSNVGCGPAELTREKRPPESLSVEGAVRWMLDHPEARVVVTQCPEKDIFAPRELTPVIDRLIRDHRVPLELERGAMQPASRETEPGLNSRASSLAWSGAVPVSGASVSSATSSLSASEHSTPPVALSQSAGKRGGWRPQWWMAAALVGGSSLLGWVLRDGDGASQLEPEPNADAPVLSASKLLAAKEVGPGHRAADLAAEAEEGASGGDAALQGSPAESAARPSETRAEPSSDPRSQGRASFGDILRVPASACELEECVAEPSSLSAVHLIQLARAELMGGRNQAAHQRLCSAADKSPTGAGSLALSRFYLDHHCPVRAQRAASQVLAAEVGERDVHLLRADWESQLGRSDAGAAQLATGIGVAPQDEATLRAVSRKYLRDALTALRHSSLALAERDLRRAVMLWPEHVAAASWLAHVLERRGLTSVARTWARWVLEQSEHDQMARAVLSRTEPRVGAAQR